MIKTFADEDTERIFRREQAKRMAKKLQRIGLRKLVMLDAATSLEDLRVPPNNRLEKLVAARAGQYSIRVNRQWRICFQWSDGDVYEVELVDYH